VAKIAYCGLDCEGCGERTEEKRDRARKLQSFVPEMDLYVQYLQDPRYKGWSVFKEVLSAIAEHPDCPTCRHGGGLPGCEARKCAKERGVTFCYMCSDFPCERLDPAMVEASKRAAGL
jgi:hypothetical protein